MTKTVTVQAQQKWEYCVANRKSEGALLEELNAFGNEGWELIHVEYYKDLKGVMTWTAFLKRPSAGDAPPAAQAHAQAAVKPAEKPKEAVADAKGFDLSDGDFDFKEE